MRSISTSRVSTRPAFVSRSSSSSNSLSGSATEFAADEHLVAVGVEAHVADLEDVGGGRSPRSADRDPAQRGAHTGDQLAQPERLGHVVVGADLEADHRVDLGVARGHHDDRHPRARAQLAAHVDAGDLRAASRRAARARAGSRRSVRSPRGRRPRSRRGSPRAASATDSASRYDCSSSTTRISGGSAISVLLGGTRSAAAPSRSSRARAERERRALALARLDGDLAAVGLRDVAHDRQTEPGAAGVAAARPVDPVEALEDPLEVARRDPDAVIAHRRARRRSPTTRAPISTGCAGPEYLIALSSRLMSALRICRRSHDDARGRAARRATRIGTSAAVGGGLHDVDGLRRSSSRTGIGSRRRRLLRLDRAEVEQVVDDAGQAVGLVHDPLGQLLHDRDVVGRGHRLGEQPERADRRLQLVAHVGDEVAAHALDAPRFRDVARVNATAPTISPSRRSGNARSWSTWRGGP